MKKILALIGIVTTLTSLCACKSKEESQAEAIGKRFSTEISQPSAVFDRLDQQLKEEVRMKKEASEK